MAVLYLQLLLLIGIIVRLPCCVVTLYIVFISNSSIDVIVGPILLIVSQLCCCGWSYSPVIIIY